MKRFDLDLCDGEAGFCYASLSEEINGDYVLFDDVDAELTALRAQIETMREALEWPPIESAPRDGTRVLVARKTYEEEWRVCEAWWSTPWEGAPITAGYWLHDGDMAMLDASVHGIGASRWTPLPQPPEAQQPQQAEVPNE